nr:hypothetical protein 1573p1_00119 [Serratia marcescens]
MTKSERRWRAFSIVILSVAIVLLYLMIEYA